MQYATKAKIIMILVPLIVTIVFGAAYFQMSRALLSQTALPSGVGVTTDKPQYSIGQTVTALLFNTSKLSVYVMNGCPKAPLAVYHLLQGRWVQVQAITDSSKCIGEPRQYEVPSGRIVQVDYGYWQSLFSEPGDYRIVANYVSYGGEATANFSIVR